MNEGGHDKTWCVNSLPPSPQWYISTPVSLLLFSRVEFVEFYLDHLSQYTIPQISFKEQDLNTTICRARNNGRSTDNVRTDCGFDRSNVRLAGHVDRSKFNRIENEINLSFLLFSCISCYLSNRCVLRNFDMKSR